MGEVNYRNRMEAGVAELDNHLLPIEVKLAKRAISDHHFRSVPPSG
jgi:hypothetical protein